MEVVGWEGGREEGGGAPGEGDICSPCIFHKGEIERWERAWKGERERQTGRQVPAPGWDEEKPSAEEAGPTAQPSPWLPPRGRAACPRCGRVPHQSAGACVGWVSTGGFPNHGQPLPDWLYQRQQLSHRSCL